MDGTGSHLFTLYRKQLLSREEDIKRRLSPQNPPLPTPSPLSHPPHPHIALSSLQMNPLSTQSPLPSSPHITTPQSHQSHTSDRTWEVTNDDIIADSLSEVEDDEEFLLPLGQLLYSAEKGGEGGRGKGVVVPENEEVIQIDPSPPMGGTQISSPSCKPPFQPPRGTASNVRITDTVEIHPSPPAGGTRNFNPPKPASFKPPFSSAVRPPCSSPSFRPSQGAMPDNATEFQGPYPHTQEMMKIFTLVLYIQYTHKYMVLKIHTTGFIWRLYLGGEEMVE